MFFLQTEPVFVISLEEILWGALLIGISMGVHGVGMLTTLRVNHSVKHRLAGKKSMILELFPIILTACIIVIVHLSETVLWAAFFLWKGCFNNRSTSYYFALNEYTTVGSVYSLPKNWRLLEGMIATTGMLAFAWSTGILFTLAKEFQDHRLPLFGVRKNKRR
jgi:hypothetical protein